MIVESKNGELVYYYIMRKMKVILHSWNLPRVNYRVCVSYLMIYTHFPQNIQKLPPKDKNIKSVITHRVAYRH